MEKGNFEGYFTNHSLRRSGGTRLFRAGIDRKLVKEVTGHHSDAVDQYQITGHDQRKLISKVVQGQISKVVDDKAGNCERDSVIEELKSVKSKPDNSITGQLSACNVTEIVDRALNATTKKGKTIIRFEIEIQNE